MSQIKQLLLLHQQGKGKKTIAGMLGISRTTVKTYLGKLEALTTAKKGQQQAFTLKDLVKMEDPVLESKFHPGNPAYKDDRFDHFKENTDYYLKELKRTGVTKRLLWEEYKEENVEGYGYSQFCYHLSQHKTASSSMKLDHKPAEKLYIDFAGKKLSYIDRETGEHVECQVFAACLPYSDYGFAIAVKSQTTEDFLYALQCCLEAIGGVPQALVPDNLKAAVIKANRYEPVINRAMEDFANHYETTVVPARPYKAKDKGLVENQVKLIYSRVYAKLRKLQFFDLHSLNKAIKEKIREHNQTRMQLNPYCREEKFLADEKKLLSPLPVEKFELKCYKELKVAKNNYVLLVDNKIVDKQNKKIRHYYSVPYKLIGRMVKLIHTRSMVYIFYNGQQVAVHAKGFKQGSYTTVKGHLCSHHQHYRDRSPEYYIRQAEKTSKVLHRLVSLIFSQDRYPEQLYKTCDGLFSLQRKTETDRFEKACQMAIDYENYTYTFIKNILENKMTELEPETDKPLPKHENLRGKEYYQTQIKF